jgi:hypothetical protein
VRYPKANYYVVTQTGNNIMILENLTIILERHNTFIKIKERYVCLAFVDIHLWLMPFFDLLIDPVTSPNRKHVH